MIRHIVTWRLAAEDAAQRDVDARGIADRLHALAPVVPGIVALHVGVDLGETDGNWDVVLVSDHDSRAALAGYQSHPAHLEVAGFIRSVVAERSAVDLEL